MSSDPVAQLEESSLKRPLEAADDSTEPPAKKQKVEPVNETPAVTNVAPNTETIKPQQQVGQILPPVQANTIAPVNTEQTTLLAVQPGPVISSQAPANNTVAVNTAAQANNNPKPDEVNHPTRAVTDIVNPLFTNRSRSAPIRDEYKTKTPFNYTILTDFFNEAFLEDVKKGLEQEEWIQKRSDHYTYEVTSDLKSSSQPAIRDMRNALYSEQFRDFLNSITGLPLLADEDLVATLYKQGGHSLCQDPELDTKRICFFLSLAPKEWTKQDGATLDLFALDKNGQPGSPAVSLAPQWNSLIFFEVSASTFFQVSEVCSSKEMVCIFGYFHGSPLAPGHPYTEAPLPTIPLALLPVQFRIQDWINPEYLKRDVQRKLKLRFEKDSSLALPDFLLKSKYDSIYESLKGEGLPWLLIGPFNRRHYSTLGRWGNEAESGEILQFKMFCRSKPMVSLVEQITGLSVWETHRGEIRRFATGDYTLVRDNEQSYTTEGLDVHLGFQEGTWMDEDGGYTTYLDAEDEILTLVPAANTLSLVLREVGTMRFVKHISATAAAPRYDYQNSLVLASKDDDEGEDYADEDEPYVSEDDFEDVDENEEANKAPQDDYADDEEMDDDDGEDYY